MAVQNPLARLNALHNRGLVLIEGEITALEQMQRERGKLSRDAAKDLRDIIKLLEDMREAHKRIVEEKKALKAAKATKVDEAALEEALKDTPK